MYSEVQIPFRFLGRDGTSRGSSLLLATLYVSGYRMAGSRRRLFLPSQIVEGI